MVLNPESLMEAARNTDFQIESLNKVYRLMSLLDALGGHPYLKSLFALKGGTALNLFILNIPRLSVDIDLNYIGSSDKETMLKERPVVDKAIQDICTRELIAVRRMPPDHAGGKWRLSYTLPGGESDNIDLDVNFMLRTPLWTPVIIECHPVGAIQANPVRVLDRHEIAAGKLAALAARGLARDVFDGCNILTSDGIDTDKLRLAFVVYGGINRKDWRTVGADKLSLDIQEVRNSLIPMLRKSPVPDKNDIVPWAQQMVDECRELMSAVLPLNPDETEFIRRLNDLGEIAPDLLTDQKEMKTIIQNHPGLQWKALNVKQFKGI